MACSDPIKIKGSILLLTLFFLLIFALSALESAQSYTLALKIFANYLHYFVDLNRNS